ILKTYQIDSEWFTDISSARGGSGGGGSSNKKEYTWRDLLSADFTNSYSSSGLRYFVDWWKYNDLAGGTGGLVINGISTYNMGSAEIEGPYKQINVTDLPGFTGPGQNLTQKITEALTKLASLNEDSNIRSWVLGKEKDPYVHHTYKKFKILPSPYINNKNYIIPDRQDTIIRQSQIQKVDKASIYDSLRLLPLLNKPN